MLQKHTTCYVRAYFAAELRSLLELDLARWHALCSISVTPVRTRTFFDTKANTGEVPNHLPRRVPAR